MSRRFEVREVGVHLIAQARSAKPLEIDFALFDRVDWAAHKWGVVELSANGEVRWHVLSWLLRQQADALASALNEICGPDWQARHPDWLVEVQS